MTNKTHHIDEQMLSRFVLNDPALNDAERVDIERHVVVCRGCEDLYREIQEFYGNVDTELEQNQTLGERHKKELMKQLTIPTVWTEPISSIIPRINVSVPARVWYFARKRPVVSSVSVLAFFAVLIFSINTITKSFADTNPLYFRIESKNLVVYNKKDEIVWEKPIDVDRFSSENLNTSVTKSTKIVDSDGDGINDIITIFTFLDEQLPPKNAITTYNNKGEIIWRKILGSPVQYGERNYQLDFRTDKMVFYDDGTIKRFFVLILHSHSPSAIVSLDEKGAIVGEYWNYGHFQDFALTDVDGDGKEELIATLLNDEKNETIIAAIDPKGIIGQKQSLFSLLSGIEISNALKYYSYIDQTLPFSSVRSSFSRIFRADGNNIAVYYGQSHEWLFTINFGKNLLLNDILTTDDANEKYGVNEAKEEIYKLKQAIKHWERGKPPA